MTEDIIQATAAVKAKYKQLKEERAARQEEATSALQPLIEPLKKMVPAELGEEIFTDDANFGPRFVNGKYYMGNKRYRPSHKNRTVRISSDGGVTGTHSSPSAEQRPNHSC